MHLNWNYLILQKPISNWTKSCKQKSETFGGNHSSLQRQRQKDLEGED